MEIISSQGAVWPQVCRRNSNSCQGVSLRLPSIEGTTTISARIEDLGCGSRIPRVAIQDSTASETITTKRGACTAGALMRRFIRSRRAVQVPCARGAASKASLALITLLRSSRA